MKAKIWKVIGIVFASILGFTGIVFGVLAAMGKFKTPIVYPEELTFTVDPVVDPGDAKQDNIVKKNGQQVMVYSFILNATANSETAVNQRTCFVYFEKGANLITLCDDLANPLPQYVDPNTNKTTQYYEVKCNEEIKFILNEYAKVNTGATYEEGRSYYVYITEAQKFVKASIDTAVDFASSIQELYYSTLDNALTGNDYGYVVLRARDERGLITSDPITLKIDRPIESVKLLADNEVSATAENNTQKPNLVLEETVYTLINSAVDFDFEVERPYSLKPTSLLPAKDIDIYYYEEGVMNDWLKVTPTSIQNNATLKNVMTYNGETGKFTFMSSEQSNKDFQFYLAYFPTYSDKEKFDVANTENPIRFNQEKVEGTLGRQYIKYTSVKIRVNNSNVSTLKLDESNINLGLYATNNYIALNDQGLSDEQRETYNILGLKMYQKNNLGDEQEIDFRNGEVEFLSDNKIVGDIAILIGNDEYNSVSKVEKNIVNGITQKDYKITIADGVDPIIANTRMQLTNGYYLVELSNGAVSKIGALVVKDDGKDGCSLHTLLSGSYLQIYKNNSHDLLGDDKDAFKISAAQKIDNTTNKTWNILAKKTVSAVLSLLVVNTDGSFQEVMSNQFNIGENPLVQSAYSFKADEFSLEIENNVCASLGFSDIVDISAENIAGLTYKALALVTDENGANVVDCYKKSENTYLTFSYNNTTYYIVGYVEDGHFQNKVRIKSDAKKDATLYLVQFGNGYLTGDNIIGQYIDNLESGDTVTVKYLSTNSITIKPNYVLTDKDKPSAISYKEYGQEDELSSFEILKDKKVVVSFTPSDNFKNAFAYNSSKFTLVKNSTNTGDATLGELTLDGNKITFEITLSAKGTFNYSLNYNGEKFIDFTTIEITSDDPENIQFVYDVNETPIELGTENNKNASDLELILSLGYTTTIEGTLTWKLNGDNQSVTLTTATAGKTANQFFVYPQKKDGEQEISYLSTDESIFTVTGTEITAERVGTAYLKLTSGTISRYVKVTVQADENFSFSQSKDSDSQTSGSTATDYELTNAIDYKYSTTSIIKEIVVDSFTCSMFGNGTQGVTDNKDSEDTYATQLSYDGKLLATLDLSAGKITRSANYPFAPMQVVLEYHLRTEEKSSESHMFKLTFAPNAKLQINDAWQQVLDYEDGRYVLYQGTEINLFDNAEGKTPLIYKENLDSSVIIKIDNINADNDYTFNTLDYVDITIESNGDTLATFYFNVVPNVMFTANAGVVLNSDTEYPVSDLMTLKNYKIGVTYGTTDHATYNENDLEDFTYGNSIVLKYNNEPRITIASDEFNTEHIEEIGGSLNRKYDVYYGTTKLGEVTFTTNNKCANVAVNDVNYTELMQVMAKTDIEVAVDDDYNLTSATGTNIVRNGNNIKFDQFITQNTEVTIVLTFTKTGGAILTKEITLTFTPYVLDLTNDTVKVGEEISVGTSATDNIQFVSETGVAIDSWAFVLPNDNLTYDSNNRKFTAISGNEAEIGLQVTFNYGGSATYTHTYTIIVKNDYTIEIVNTPFAEIATSDETLSQNKATVRKDESVERAVVGETINFIKDPIYGFARIRVSENDVDTTNYTITNIEVVDYSGSAANYISKIGIDATNGSVTFGSTSVVSYDLGYIVFRITIAGNAYVDYPVHLYTKYGLANTAYTTNVDIDRTSGNAYYSVNKDSGSESVSILGTEIENFDTTFKVAKSDYGKLKFYLISSVNILGETNDILKDEDKVIVCKELTAGMTASYTQYTTDKIAITYEDTTAQGTRFVILGYVTANITPAVSETADTSKVTKESNGHYTATVDGNESFTNPFTVSDATFVETSVTGWSGYDSYITINSTTGDITFDKYVREDTKFTVEYKYTVTGGSFSVFVEFTYLGLNLTTQTITQPFTITGFNEGTGFNNTFDLSLILGRYAKDLTITRIDCDPDLVITDSTENIKLIGSGSERKLQFTRDNDSHQYILKFTLSKLLVNSNAVEITATFNVTPAIYTTNVTGGGESAANPIVTETTGLYTSATGSTVTVVKTSHYRELTTEAFDSTEKYYTLSGTTYSHANDVTIDNFLTKVTNGLYIIDYDKYVIGEVYTIYVKTGATLNFTQLGIWKGDNTSNVNFTQPAVNYDHYYQPYNNTNGKLNFVHMAVGNCYVAVKVHATQDTNRYPENTDATLYFRLAKTYNGIVSNYSMTGANHDNIKTGGVGDLDRYFFNPVDNDYYCKLTTESFDSTEKYYTLSGTTYTLASDVTSGNFAAKVSSGLYVKITNSYRVMVVGLYGETLYEPTSLGFTNARNPNKIAYTCESGFANVNASALSLQNTSNLTQNIGVTVGLSNNAGASCLYNFRIIKDALENGDGLNVQLSMVQGTSIDASYVEGASPYFSFVLPQSSAANYKASGTYDVILGTWFDDQCNVFVPDVGSQESVSVARNTTDNTIRLSISWNADAGNYPITMYGNGATAITYAVHVYKYTITVTNGKPYNAGDSVTIMGNGGDYIINADTDASALTLEIDYNQSTLKGNSLSSANNTLFNYNNGIMTLKHIANDISANQINIVYYIKTKGTNPIVVTTGSFNFSVTRFYDFVVAGETIQNNSSINNVNVAIRDMDVEYISAANTTYDANKTYFEYDTATSKYVVKEVNSSNFNNGSGLYVADKFKLDLMNFKYKVQDEDVALIALKDKNGNSSGAGAFMITDVLVNGQPGILDDDYTKFIVSAVTGEWDANIVVNRNSKCITFNNDFNGTITLSLRYQAENGEYYDITVGLEILAAYDMTYIGSNTAKTIFTNSGDGYTTNYEVKPLAAQNDVTTTKGLNEVTNSGTLQKNNQKWSIGYKVLSFNEENVSNNNLKAVSDSDFTSVITNSNSIIGVQELPFVQVSTGSSHIFSVVTYQITSNYKVGGLNCSVTRYVSYKVYNPTKFSINDNKNIIAIGTSDVYTGGNMSVMYFAENYTKDSTQLIISAKFDDAEPSETKKQISYNGTNYDFVENVNAGDVYKDSSNNYYLFKSEKSGNTTTYSFIKLKQKDTESSALYDDGTHEYIQDGDAIVSGLTKSVITSNNTILQANYDSIDDYVDFLQRVNYIKMTDTTGTSGTWYYKPIQLSGGEIGFEFGTSAYEQDLTTNKTFGTGTGQTPMFNNSMDATIEFVYESNNALINIYTTISAQSQLSPKASYTLGEILGTSIVTNADERAYEIVGIVAGDNSSVTTDDDIIKTFVKVGNDNTSKADSIKKSGNGLGYTGKHYKIGDITYYVWKIEFEGSVGTNVFYTNSIEKYVLARAEDILVDTNTPAIVVPEYSQGAQNNAFQVNYDDSSDLITNSVFDFGSNMYWYYNIASGDNIGTFTRNNNGTIDKDKLSPNTGAYAFDENGKLTIRHDDLQAYKNTNLDKTTLDVECSYEVVTGTSISFTVKFILPSAKIYASAYNAETGEFTIDFEGLGWNGNTVGGTSGLHLTSVRLVNGGYQNVNNNTILFTATTGDSATFLISVDGTNYQTVNVEFDYNNATVYIPTTTSSASFDITDYISQLDLTGEEFTVGTGNIGKEQGETEYAVGENAKLVYNDDKYILTFTGISDSTTTVTNYKINDTYNLEIAILMTKYTGSTTTASKEIDITSFITAAGFSDKAFKFNDYAIPATQSETEVIVDTDVTLTYNDNKYILTFSNVSANINTDYVISLESTQYTLNVQITYTGE